MSRTGSSDDREPEPRQESRPPAGPLESLFQEAIRRATGLGISGLASTEGAVRKAVSENAPEQWMRFFSDQRDDLRRQLIDVLSDEFARFLRSEEFELLVRRLLADYEVGVHLRPRAEGEGEGEADPAEKEAAEREEG